MLWWISNSLSAFQHPSRDVARLFLLTRGDVLLLVGAKALIIWSVSLSYRGDLQADTFQILANVRACAQSPGASAPAGEEEGYCEYMFKAELEMEPLTTKPWRLCEKTTGSVL